MNEELTNPLKPIAAVGVLSLALDVYQSISARHITWLLLARGALFTGFLILYCARSRTAWLISLLLFVGITPTYFLVVLLTSRDLFPSRNTFLIMTAISVLGVVYVLRIRKRYYSYLANICSQEKR